jgi:hypothetical protein
MKKTNLIIYLNLMFLFLLPVCLYAAEDDLCFYVSTESSADADGSFDWPFGSLERARDSLRDLKKAGKLDRPVTVYLRGGDYIMQSTLEFNKEDSGTLSCPVTYRAYPGERVRLLGGASISIEQFEPVRDSSVLERLPQSVRNKVLVLNLNKKGITQYGQMSLYGHSAGFLNAVTEFKSGPLPPQLFYGGEAMQIARWPNESFARIEDVVEKGSVPRHWMDDMKGSDNTSVLATYIPPEQREHPPQGFKIRLLEERLKRWKTADDIWMYGYWYWDWSDQSVKISDIDVEEQIITTLQPSSYGVREKQRFYVYNLLEELDAPGEWYLERSSGRLYFYPPENSGGKIVELALLEEPLISVENVSDFNIHGFDISVSRGTGIKISGSENVVVSDCEISRLGALGVSIESGRSNGVRNCRIYKMAAGGISLSGGDRRTLVPARHFAVNNHIYDFGRLAKTYNPAIRISGVGNRAAFNKIHDGPHSGLIFEGNDHIIEYNEIYDVVNESQDMGAIYCGRDLTGRGNIIRHNFIHDIKGVEGGHAFLIHGIYFDDMYSGCEVVGNVFFNMPTGVLVNGGRAHNISGNIFADISNKPVIIGTSGFMKWSQKHWENHSYGLKSDPKRTNIESQGGPAVPWDKVPYTKYPHLAGILEDDPREPKYNKVTDNLLYKSQDIYIWLRGEIDFGLDRVMSYSVIKNNYLTDKNPGFRNIDELDFSLEENSIVYEKIPGFEPIPFEMIGLYADKYCNIN